MELQSKLLDKNYLDARLNEITSIKNGSIKFNIYNSDRLFSKTMYIDFFTEGNNKWYKQFSLRISNHEISTPHKQFIIKPFDPLNKKIKDKFIRLVENTINRSKMRCLYKEINKISRRGKNYE